MTKSKNTLRPDTEKAVRERCIAILTTKGIDWESVSDRVLAAVDRASKEPPIGDDPRETLARAVVEDIRRAWKGFEAFLAEVGADEPETHCASYLAAWRVHVQTQVGNIVHSKPLCVAVADAMNIATDAAFPDPKRQGAAVVAATRFVQELRAKDILQLGRPPSYQLLACLWLLARGIEEVPGPRLLDGAKAIIEAEKDRMKKAAKPKG